MDTINEYLKRTTNVKMLPFGFTFQEIRPRVKCADGFEVSVQASENHYCEPRINGAEQYESVELGYPNMEEPELMEYAEDPVDPTGTVYGWVPVELVNKLIDKHGGII
jgi:hypothetical protein